MSDSAIENIKDICIRCSDGLNYYDILGLDKSSSLEEVQRALKSSRMKIYFHPDQEAFILKQLPQEFHNIYFAIRDEYVNIEYTFSSEQNKAAYDESLIDITEEIPIITENDIKITNALKTNAEKYGWEYTFNSLKGVLISGDYRSFTRTGDARSIMQSIPFDELKSTIVKKVLSDDLNLSIDQIIYDYLGFVFECDPELHEQYSALEDACYSTLHKYTPIYGSDMAINQVMEAINLYTSSFSLKGFTNTDGARDRLRSSLIDPKNINFMMLVGLNKKRKDDPTLGFENGYINSIGVTKKAFVYSIYKQIYGEQSQGQRTSSHSYK